MPACCVTEERLGRRASPRRIACGLMCGVQIARRKRLAEKHARMQRQLAEKQARDLEEVQQQDQQYKLRAFHHTRIEAWKSGKKVRSRQPEPLETRMSPAGCSAC